MNSTNSKTYDGHILLLNLTDKINLKRSDIFVALSNLAWTIHGKKKNSYRNNKFQISPPTWNQEFKLRDGFYSIFKIDIQDYFEYLFKHTEKDCYSFNKNICNLV